MSNFDFTATAECWRCGNYLSSSDEACQQCSDKQLRRYRFQHLVEDVVQTVWAIDPIRAWNELHNQHVDSVLPWRLVETGDMSIDCAQQGYDVTDSDDLRKN